MPYDLSPIQGAADRIADEYAQIGERKRRNAEMIRLKTEEKELKEEDERNFSKAMETYKLSSQGGQPGQSGQPTPPDQAGQPGQPASQPSGYQLGQQGQQANAPEMTNGIPTNLNKEQFGYWKGIIEAANAGDEVAQNKVISQRFTDILANPEILKKTYGERQGIFKYAHDMGAVLTDESAYANVFLNPGQEGMSVSEYIKIAPKGDLERNDFTKALETGKWSDVIPRPKEVDEGKGLRIEKTKLEIQKLKGDPIADIDKRITALQDKALDAESDEKKDPTPYYDQIKVLEKERESLVKNKKKPDASKDGFTIDKEYEGKVFELDGVEVTATGRKDKNGTYEAKTKDGKIVGFTVKQTERTDEETTKTANELLNDWGF